MADGVSLRVEADAASRTLADAVRRVDRPKPMFELIGASLVTSTQRRFELGVSPDGNPWPPSIRVLTEGGKTMIDSGRLVGSVTFEATDSQVAVGTNAIYAAVHQFGATIRPVQAQRLHFVIAGRDVFASEVKIPARPFLGLDEDDEREIELIAEEYVLAEGARDAN